jgi:hypothetical protein
VTALGRNRIRTVEAVLLVLYLYIRNTKTTATKLMFLGKKFDFLFIHLDLSYTPSFYVMATVMNEG